jgi:hypothetical protein
MLPFFSERIAYGRAIRAEADSLVRRHGPAEAERQARAAAGDRDRDASERMFFAAVAMRLGRLARHAETVVAAEDVATA